MHLISTASSVFFKYFSLACKVSKKKKTIFKLFAEEGSRSISPFLWPLFSQHFFFGTCSFPGIYFPQGLEDVNWVETQHLLILVRGGLHCWCVVQCIEPSKVVIKVIQKVSVVSTGQGSTFIICGRLNSVPQSPSVTVVPKMLLNFLSMCFFSCALRP